MTEKQRRVLSRAVWGITVTALLMTFINQDFQAFAQILGVIAFYLWAEENTE